MDDHDYNEIEKVQIMGVVRTAEIDQGKDPRKPDHTLRTIGRDNLQSIHSGTLATDNTVTTLGANVVTFLPERIIIVARLSAGSLKVHLGAGRSVNYIKMDHGTIVLPMISEGITIENVGATGFYSVYFVVGHKDLQIVS